MQERNTYQLWSEARISLRQILQENYANIPYKHRYKNAANITSNPAVCNKDDNLKPKGLHKKTCGKFNI